MLNEALLPKGPAREDPPEPTLGKAATAAAAKATALEGGEPEPDRADMNRDILLAAAGLLPDGVDSVVAAAAAQAAPMAAKQQPGHGNGDGGYDAEEALESLYGGYNLPDSSSASAATTHVPGYNEGDGSEYLIKSGHPRSSGTAHTGPAAHATRHLQGEVRTAIAFVRSMIGAAALYFPRMFFTGGLAFSTVVLVAACALSIYNIILLSRAHDRLGVQNCRSYGDIVFVAWGRPGKWLVDCFQAINQISWVPVYFIFVQQNLVQAIPGLSHLSRETLILLQLLVYVPLSLLRQIKYLSSANLVANVFVLVGLFACIAWSCVVLARDGPAPDVQLFNRHDCWLFLGAVAVSFEGMSLVLPIKRSMKRPQHFERLVVCCMSGILLTVWCIGALGYLAFGNDVEPFISNELPTKGFLGPMVRVLYSLAIMCTYPLQIFPGTLILEEYLIEPCGLPAPKRKVAKNCLRTLVVVATCVTAIYAGKALDHFVSLIGTIGSIPLGLIVPTLAHLWIFWPETPNRTRALHALLATVGFVCMILSGSITISTW